MPATADDEYFSVGHADGGVSESSGAERGFQDAPVIIIWFVDTGEGGGHGQSPKEFAITAEYEDVAVLQYGGGVGDGGAGESWGFVEFEREVGFPVGRVVRRTPGETWG